MLNRLANVGNPYQGKFKRVLCVCSAGLLRSPTTALVLSQELYNHNTRAAGLNKEYALIPVDAALIEWADEIVCMEAGQADKLATLTDKPILCLGVDDEFRYRDPVLMETIRNRYDALREVLDNPGPEVVA